MRIKGRTGLVMALFLLGGLGLSWANLPEDPDSVGETIAGFPAEKAFALGKRIYREGVLHDGEAVQAILQRDIVVDGRMITCMSCHLRSGLGTDEGTKITPPATGHYLFRPKVQAWRPDDPTKKRNKVWESLPDALDGKALRPAYTKETLARALREGVDPTGKPLDRIMPRFELDDRDMALLVHYLEGLSSKHAPGVSDETIRFATVVAGPVDERSRRSMLGVLKAHIDAVNAQTRGQSRRAERAPFYKQERYTAFRKLSLSVWELEGPEAGWQQQLEELYSDEPVFALIGGISEGSWEPVHRFCEEREVPALFPVTDLPVISDDDWYTLYFSRGLFQEGAASARYLRRAKDLRWDARILQVYRPGGRGEAVARGFDTTWKKMRRSGLESALIESDGTVTAETLNGLLTAKRPDALLLWLDRDDLGGLDLFAKPGTKAPLIFIASGLAGEEVAFVPETVRSSLRVTFPFAMPDEKRKNVMVLGAWLRARKLEPEDVRIQSDMYFLGTMLTAALMMMRNEFHRDYFLDVIDMMIDQTYTTAVYPRLSFGPGQRYASKGCYIARPGPGPEGRLEKVSDWVVH